MRITWHGNACFRIECGGSTVVIDPYFSRQPGTEPLRMDDLDGVAAILVNHGHFDHVADVPRIVERYGVPVYAPAAVAANLQRFQRMPASAFRPAEPGVPFVVGPMTITPWVSAHVKFDLPLLWELLAKLFVTRIHQWPLFVRDMRDHRVMPEGGCLAYEIACEGKRQLHFGSLGFDPARPYPRDVDLLSFSYQGNTRVLDLALELVAAIRPRAVLLNHFDDAFPPLSRLVDPRPFVLAMAGRHPGTRVVVPEYRLPLEF